MLCVEGAMPRRDAPKGVAPRVEGFALGGDVSEGAQFLDIGNGIAKGNK